jgi:integrase
LKRPHGHGTVEEHPKGSGKFRVRARSGGEMRTIVSGLTRAAAEEHRAAYASLRQADELRAGITLSQFGIGFLDRRGRRVRSIDEDRNRWATYIDGDAIGGIPVSALRRSDVVEWRDRLLTRTSRRGRKGLRPQTVKNALSLLCSALDEALDRELAAANVAEDVKLPRGLGTTQKLDLEGILLPDEQTALLAAVPAHQRPAVLFALAMGVRWSEVSWLKWEDVRVDAVVIRRSKRGLATKSGKPRRLPLSPPARLALEGAAALRKGGNPWVFPGPKKQAPRKQAPSQWEQWISAAGITKHVRFHDLRHTTATSLIAGWWGEKWSLEEVRRQLGHASIQVTERYARLLDELLDDAVARTSFALFEVPIPTMLPQGADLAASPGDRSRVNVFVNRRSGVQIPKLAPNNSATLPARAEPTGEQLGSKFAGHKARENWPFAEGDFPAAAWSLGLIGHRLGLLESDRGAR